jgi:hypothetical protein
MVRAAARGIECSAFANPRGSHDVSETPSSDPQPHKGWSDRKADTVSVLVIFTALVLMALQFVSGGLSS